MSTKLSKFFFALAGLLIVFVIIQFILNEFVASDDIFSLVPSIIKANLGVFSPFFLLLFLLFIFSSLGYYFASYQSNIRSVDLATGKKPVKIDWPFYMMVSGLLFPFGFPYILISFGLVEGYGAIILYGISSLAGVILVVLGAFLLFINRNKQDDISARVKTANVSFTLVFVTFLLLCFLVYWFF